ncbi:MAG: EamA family transporter [Luteimonas sp.]|nr:EamA family transporter [Luteimonas sp.]
MTTVAAWLPWALGSALFAALTAVFAKAGLQGIDPDYATLVRTAFIAVVLALFVAFTGKWSDPRLLPARSWGFLLASALATGASWVCYFRALQAGPTAAVAAVDKFSVVLVAVFALALLHERLDARGWLGVLLVAAGVVVLALRR